MQPCSDPLPAASFWTLSGASLTSPRMQGSDCGGVEWFGAVNGVRAFQLFDPHAEYAQLFQTFSASQRPMAPNDTLSVLIVRA